MFHLLDHCCHQHLSRPTADDGRARCLVMEHPLHWCDGCGFTPSPVPTPQHQLGMTPRRAAPTPPPLIEAAGVGLSSSSPTTPRLPCRRPAVKRQGRRRRKRRRRGTPSGTGPAAVLRPVQRIHAWHEPPPADALNRFNIQPIMRTEDCRRDRNPNGDHHLRQQATSQSHSRVYASDVIVRKKQQQILVTHPAHDHLKEGCRRV